MQPAQTTPSPPPNEHSPRLVIVWRVTTACNLGCRFCAYSNEVAGPRAAVDPSTVLDFGRLLGRYRALRGREILVSWLGGEPFLWKPIGELSRRFRREFDLRLSATTNGTALRSEAVRSLVVELFDELIVSVDGAAGFHDWARAQSGLFASLEEVIPGLDRERRAQGSRLRIKVNTILMRDNIEAFERLGETLRGWGVEELTFNQLGGNDRPEFYPAHRLLPSQVDRFVGELPAIRERLLGRGLRVNGGPQYLRRLIATSRNLTLPVDDCHPGMSFLFIDEEGRMSPCSFTTADYGIPIARVADEHDFDRIASWFSEARREHRARSCDDCHSTQVFEKFEPRS